MEYISFTRTVRISDIWLRLFPHYHVKYVTRLFPHYHIKYVIRNTAAPAS